jgi:hypothetical protein
MAFLLGGLVTATIVLLEPAKSAVSNWSDIGIGFSELFAKLAVPFAIAFFCMATLAALMTAAAPRRAIPMLVALYVALWAQGNLFIWEYGSFDGSPIDWHEHSAKGLLEIVFWAATLALAVTRYEWISRRALLISVMVFALQLAVLADQIRQNAPFSDLSDREMTVVHDIGTTELSLIRSVSQFSLDLNVIVIVLDSLQSDFFSEAIRDPKLRAAIPPGFTYFRNATSLYESTEFSLQSILTSRAIPDNVNLKQWIDEQVPGTMPARLSERNFDAVLTTFSQAHYNYFDAWGYRRVLSASMAESGSASEGWREDVSNLFAIGLFRLSPHFLKSQVYDNGIWQTRRLYSPRDAISQDLRIQYETRTDLAVFDELIASASAGDITPRFRFLHFYGTHRPYSVDENCSYQSRIGISRVNVVAMTQCIVSRLFEFLHKLDEIGIYDRSLIFVVADHGEKYVRLDPSAAWPKLPESESHHDAAERRGATSIERHWQGVPLFLSKPLDDRQPFRVSDHPVSLCDVPKSVFDALSIEHDFECESIFSGRSPRQIPRIHYRYPNRDEQHTLGLSAWSGLPFEKFSVVGHSWLPESWGPYRADPE